MLAMVNRIIIFAYISVCRIIIVLIVGKVDDYSLLQLYAFLKWFSAFRTSQLQRNIMYPSIFVFLLTHAQRWTSTFPEPLLKYSFMHFLNPFLVGNFVKLVWLYVKRYVCLGSLEFISWVFWISSMSDLRTE